MIRILNAIRFPVSCRFSIATLLLILSFPVLSAAQPPVKHRPSVGLVLSGGGAKGFAYIGLLRVIREAGLPVDYIGGSSIGSIIGALYAVGYHPDTIAKLIRSQKWDPLMKDEMDRKYVAFEEKGIGEKTLVRLPLVRKKILISSMHQGREIGLLLNRFYSPAYKTRDFRKLPTPFLCIGTDLVTGEAIVLDSGYLPAAIRASMSIPGYFEPVDFQGHYMVDGGVVNNYPVKEVKEMGAEIILGGDVQSGLYSSRELLGSIPAVLDQITSFARVRANEIGDSLTDIKVRIKMPYGMLDFEQYDSIMAFGEKIARQHYPEIKALADSLNALEYRPVNPCKAAPLDSVRIDTIRVTGNEKLPDAYFKSIFGAYTGHTVALADIERDIHRTYGSGYFINLTYELDYQRGKSILVLHATEGGPGEVAAGIHYDSDYGICLMLGGTFRNILGKNSKVIADLNIAMDPRIRATYLLGFGGQGAIGTTAEFYTQKVNTYAKNLKENAFNLTNFNVSTYFNYNFRNLVNLQAGFQYEYFRFRQDIVIDTLIDEFRDFSSYGNVFLKLNADTRNRPNFATRGIKASLKVEYVMPFSKNWSSELFTNSGVLSLEYDHFVPLSRRFTLQPGLFCGLVMNKNQAPPVHHLFGLGGLAPENYIESFVPFTGMNFVQEFGDYSLVGRMKLQYNVFKKIYLNLRADAGGNELVLGDLFSRGNLLFGYGASVSYDSFIGPLEFTVMSSNITSGVLIFLNLGFWF